MLAYLFWHRPAAGVDRAEYEEAQRRFHAAIELPSACFRLGELPFGRGGEGYEDWYLVEDWAGLGALNEAAVDAGRRPHHDRAAALVGPGWAGVYRLLRGAAEVPAATRWLEKPRGQAVEQVLDGLGEGAAWQRQMVLGPAPELCLAAPGDVSRHQVC